MTGDSLSDSFGRGERRLARWLLALLLVAFALAVVLTFDDYGATYDEAVQAHYGELALRYFATGGADRSCDEFKDLRFYGPLVEMLPALLYDGNTPAKYDVRHLFLALLALLSLPAVWGYTRLFGDARAATFAVLATATMPRFYGHWFNNSKDTSFAVAVVWFLYALAVMFRGPRVSWRGAAGCGVAMGVALCARPGGLPLFVPFVAGTVVLWLLTRPPGQPTLVATGRDVIPKLLLVFVLAWVLMVLPWPWAHRNPFTHPVEAMVVATQFATTVPVWFAGHTFSSAHLPALYLPWYVLITTPLAVLALAALGVIAGAFDRRAGFRSVRTRMTGVTLVWLVLPIVGCMVARPNIHGGLRHFLFVLPALGVLAGVGGAAVVDLARRPAARIVAWVVVVGALLLPVKDLIRLHPYEVVYYNELVGGVRGASRGYWTDYWLSSYREAIEWVNARASATPDQRVTVVIAASPAVMMWATAYAAPNVELVALRDLPPGRRTLAPADFFIATTRNHSDRPFPEATVAYTIGRDGAVFTVVKAAAQAPR